MKKFYPATAAKRNAIVGRFLAITAMVFVLLFQGNRVSAQVSLTATAGTLTGTYSTLKAAFDAINAGTHQGTISISITGNTAETATAALNSASIAPASYSSVTIQPTANVTVSGNIAGALVKLNGADNVTINGLLAGTRQLTFNNTNASASAVGVWLACASAADGATNNIIRNCNINGATLTTTLAGIASSGITLGTVAETANANNTYENNAITTSQYGIAVVGPSSMETGTIIRGNIIGSTTAANKIYFRGIFISNQQNISVTQNTIQGVAFASGSTTLQGSGIYVVGAISGGSIDRNNISDVSVASVWGCNGIQLNSSTANTGLVIANNFIYNIFAGGFSTFDTVDDNGTGIAVNTGGGYNIWYNSINLTTNQGGGITAAIWFGTDVSLANLNVRNNIFANSQTTATRYAIYSNSPNTIFSSINYNDYYSTGAAIGFLLTTSYATITNWQTATGQDGNSVSIIPNFTSTTDLHLLGSSALDALATPIGSITTDYDGAARNVTTPDMGADEFTPPNCTGNSGGTASASVTDICASGSSILSSTGYSFGLGSAYQWEFFNGVSWVSLAGQTNPASANTGTITTTTQYRLRVTCNAGAPGYSNTVTITVNNPTVTSTTPGSRCGVGTVNLAAVGTNLKWYSAATGGTLLGTGSPFTTPVISATTQFYVSASTTGISATGGKASTTGADGGYNGAAGLVFDAYTSFKISSVLMYPQGTTNVTIQAQDNTGATIPGCTYTVNFTGATSTGVVVPIDFTIPVGTGHRLVITNNSAGVPIWRDFSGNTYPYALGALGSITGGYISGSSTAYYFFYNWQVTSACEGLRTAVTATVTAPPAITPSATPATVCGGANVSLNVTSANAGYSYVWTPGTLSGAAQTVNPVATTTYTVTATDATAGPFAGCVNVATVNVTVNATPTNLTVSPAVANVCASPVVTQLTASGGLISNQTVAQELFETAFGSTSYTLGGSGLSATQNTTYYQSGTSSVYLQQTSTTTMDGDIRMNSSVNLTNYTSPQLSFYHICGLEGSTTAFDFGYIEYSTDGGTSWTSFPTSTYSGTGTLFNSVVSFSSLSYSDWNSQFNGTSSTPGTGPATALWKKETIDLSSYTSQSNFRIRFRLTGDINTVYYGWLIDSVRISGTGQAPVTWSPTAELFTDPGGLTPYLGGPALTVYTKPTGSRIYTATATGGAGCTKTATSNLTVTSITVGISIAASPSNNICAGTSVTFTATPTNGGTNPFYQWYVNGTGPVASGIGLNTYTTSTLVNGDIVTCTLLSNVGGCASNNPATSNAITMTVNPIPSVNITGPNTVCNGAPPITLTANASVTPGSISTYQWFLGGVSQGAPSGVSTFNATAAGTYTVTATSLAGCPQTSANFVVTLPTYTITATAGPNGTISPSGAVVVNCGDNQTFTITPNGGFAIQDVLVDGVSQGAIGTYTFTNVTGPHTISATFFIAGCANPPTASAGANTSICANQSYTLAGSIGGSATVGTWSGGTGTFTPNNTTLNASYTPSAAEISAGTVTLTLTTNNPNGAPCVVSTSNITITIKEIPSVSISGTLGFCPSSSTTLTASATINPAGPITYNWLFNGVTPLGSLATQSSLPAGAGSYQVTATGNGCSNTETVSVVAFTPPTISITGSNVICTNTNTLLSASVTLGSGSISGNTYVWKRGGVTIGGATTSSLSTNTPGTYTVQVTDDNGCASAVSANFVLTNDSSPLNGNYTISTAPASCTNYISFVSAINDLNTRGISGNVRFSVSAGYTETVPSGGLQLGSATLNASVGANTILFEKSGVGANPLLTAYAGGTFTPSTASLDGIFAIKGTDNVTISQIDLTDPNTTNPSTMEYGYGLFKFDATNGTQNATILNCTITLNKANNTAAGTLTPNGSSAILVINSTTAAANTALTPTGAAGTNSNNKFYGNTIRNCNNGIALIGFAATSPFTLADTNNDIGGTSGSTGNSIEAFGGGGTVQCAGIWINNQWSLNVSYNDLNNTNSSGVAHTGVIRGIYGIAATGASIVIGNNNVTLTSASTTSACAGIENAVGSTGSGNTVTISSNTVSVLSGSATTGNATAITNSASASTVNINNNIVQNCTLTGSGNWTGISNTTPVASLSMTGNTVQNNNIASTGTTFTPFSNTTSTTTGATTLLMSNNTINNNTKAGSTTGALTVNWLNTAGEVAPGTMTATVNNNTITNNTVTVATQNATVGCLTGSRSTYTYNGNIISNNVINNITGTLVGTLRGINNISAATSEVISNNQISKLYVNGNGTAVHTIQGILTNTGATSVKNIFGNRVDTLQTAAAMVGTVIGIQNTTGTTVNIYSNKVGYLSTGTGVATTLTGILNTSGTNINIYQDSIYNITAANTAAIIHGINITGGTTPTIYKNNISSLSGSGTGAVVCNGISITSTAVTVKIDQNKIFNLSETGAITASPAVNGINIAGGGASPTMTVSNNFISDLKAPLANSNDAIRGIAQLTSLATSTYNVWYNTIYLNATSTGANFGTTGVYSTTTGVSTSANFVFRNNIVINESVANGTGLIACIRRSAAGFVNAGTWNNNVLWAGSTQTSPRLLFYDGTAGGTQPTLAGYQTYSSREAASLSARPTFVQEATAPYDLHLKPDFNCSFDNVGDNTGIGNNKDIDDDPRNTGTPNNITDIGADEFTASGSGAGVWRGVNTNWLDVNNWCGSIPTNTTDVTIPSGAPFYPIITTATPVVRNISVNAGGSITVSGASGKLTIYGSITPGGTFDVGDGTIEMAGSVAQTIPASTFLGDSIKNLIINNATVNLAGSLHLTRQLSFTGSNRTFNTNGNLTLRSRMLRTANVADITNNGTNTGNQITGDVTVERYISAKRAWRFLSVPTQNNLQTIKESWQENQAANAATPAGFGIQITSDRASWATDGFDLLTSAGGPSVKTYDPVTNAYVGIISTVNVVAPTPNNGRFTTGEGYMTFIRGDRTVNTFPQAPTPTVLRSKGALVTGTFGPVAVGAGLFKAIGNPYASALDFSKLTRSNVQDLFYVWDPQIGTLGGYVAFAGPFYSPSVSAPSYAGGNKLIESGSAFIVRAPGVAGTISITEPSKDPGNNLVQRANDVQPFIRTNLYHLPTAGGQVLFDGLWLRFDPAYQNGEDFYDALKMDNSGETVAAQVGDKTFAIDSRMNITADDTIQLKLGHIRAQNYQFEVITGNNLEQFGVEAFVEDKYLNSKTPVSLSGTTIVPFTVVNEPGSYAADRFRIVFKRLAPVPVSFTQVRADKQQQGVLVSWKVDNESRIDHYEVEESADGVRFSRANSQAATGNNNSSVQYQWLDQQVNRGYNYYRIRSIGLAGETKISETVKVNITEAQPALISVYPNPVQADRQLKVNMVNSASGVYKLNLYNVQGQIIYSAQLNHGGGNSVYTLSLDPLLAKGQYTLDLTSDNNEKSTFKVIVN